MKTKRANECRSPFGIHSRGLYVEKSKWIYIDWHATIEQIDSIMEKWRIALQTCDEVKLDLPSSADTEDTWTSVLLNFTIHNAYHIGQIISIRKQPGSWNKVFINE
ncbi:hypothetical protein QUF88_10430 [Bacillus sp. DX1.1]|uniref:hypothetical protein n=1 Tax=unclassified Bacillus (in: firmicutes) TaxID=185979 RepID=UPI0025703AA0|nr:MULTISPECIES: hypothetical protein [unclassified Bacillus (in: firmicutes)]MDM5154238.1 hypothetical protein [Bacillus sp. DX1.1]WJE83158.1 hypothetical protein QRE67_07935 [Bacillus sp. DX3.1]